MEFVQPIRDPKQIQAIKKILLAQSTRNHLLFVLGINCGLRISDILQLRVGDVVNDRGKPRPFYELRERKTKKGDDSPSARTCKGPSSCIRRSSPAPWIRTNTCSGPARAPVRSPASVLTNLSMRRRVPSGSRRGLGRIPYGRPLDTMHTNPGLISPYCSRSSTIPLRPSPYGISELLKTIWTM